MKSPKSIFLISLLVVIIVAFLLISGNSLLLVTLSEEPYIPAGTIITALGLIALPLAIYTGTNRFMTPINKTDRIFAKIFRILILAAILWIPICYILAGNLSFTFSEKATFQGGQLAMRIFWNISYFIGGAPLVVWLVYWVVRWFKRE